MFMPVRTGDNGIARVFAYYWQRYPLRLAFLFVLLTVAGFAEGIGILGLLPLMEGATAVNVGIPGLNWLMDAFRSLGSQAAMVAAVVGLIWIKAALRFASLILGGVILAEIGTDVRMQIIDGLLRARMTYLSSQHGGRFANTLGVEASKAAGTASILLRLASSALQAIILLGFAVLTDLTATLIGLGVAVALLFTFSGLSRMAGAAGTLQANSYRELSEQLVNALSGLKPLRAMGRQSPLRDNMEVAVNDIATGYRRDVMARSMLSSLQEPFMFTVIALGLIGANYAGVRIEQFIVVAVLMYRLGTAVAQLQGSHQDLVANTAYFWSFQAAGRELAQAPENKGGDVRLAFADRIVFEDVRYAYGDREVLAGVSLVIPYGSYVALRGASGAGKSTLIDLLCGFDAPTAGRILVDGQDLRLMDVPNWRGQIGYVPQELTLLHDTVYNNVAIGTRVDEAAVRDALQRAGALDFVQNLPAGLHSPVGERGTLLSGGQRQRLALARAIVHKPRLLILDEATTALDPATEAEICRTLRSLAGEMTIIAISHQRAVVDEADMTYELDRGRIAAPEKSGDAA